MNDTYIYYVVFIYFCVKEHTENDYYKLTVLDNFLASQREVADKQYSLHAMCYNINVGSMLY